MALDIASKYPGRSNAASAAYPFGSARNITTPGDGTGTLLEEAWLNDLFGFLQSILSAAGITPSGSPDEVGASQYLTSLEKLAPFIVSDATALRAKEPEVDYQLAILTQVSGVLGLGGDVFFYDPADSTTADDGVDVFVTSGGARWFRRRVGPRTPEMAGATPGEVDSSAAIGASFGTSDSSTLDGKGYNATAAVTLDGGKHLSGGFGHMAGRLTTDSGVVMTGAFGSLSNMTVDTGTNDIYAVELQNPSGFSDFGNHVHGVRATGLKGLNILAYETKLYNLYLAGEGDDVAGGRAIDIDQYDTSIHTAIVQDYESGVDTYKGLQASDLHIVRCKRALTFREQGEPSQLINTYIDTPTTIGARCIDQSSLAMVNTQFLKVGTAETAADANAIRLDTNSPENAFIVANFNQPDPSTVNNLIYHELGSINNLYVALMGAYKMATDTQRQRLRNQTMIGGMGGWARFNNVPRKCRAQVSSIAVSATVQLDFTLDYTYDDTDTFNTLLFYGKYVSRNANSQGNVGDLYIPIQYDDTGCAPVLTKVTGHANNSWSVVSATLTGNVLSVTLQNDGTSTAAIAVELERSLDANARDF